jgi:hypothetical protein
MTWAKVDDRLHGHAKAARAGEALSLWVLALSWCAAYLTDGEVPREQPARLIGAKGPRFAARLVEVGLWETTESGFKFHDWHDYQPSSGDVQAKRAEAKTRMQRIRGVGEDVRANKERTSREPTANFARSSESVRDSFATPVPVPVPNPDQRDKNPLPTGVGSARASAHAHTHEGLALEVEAPKAKRARVKAAPPPDTIPPEGTAAHRVYLAVVRDSALGPVTTGPGDLAMRLVAIADGTTVDPAAEVVAAGAWLARHPGRWRDGASGLVSWIKRAADDARRMPVAAPPVAQGRQNRLTRDVSRGPLDSAPVGSFEIAPEDEYDWLAPVGAQR